MHLIFPNNNFHACWCRSGGAAADQRKKQYNPSESAAARAKSFKLHSLLFGWEENNNDNFISGDAFCLTAAARRAGQDQVSKMQPWLVLWIWKFAGICRATPYKYVLRLACVPTMTLSKLAYSFFTYVRICGDKFEIRTLNFQSVSAFQVPSKNSTYFSEHSKIFINEKINASFEIQLKSSQVAFPTEGMYIKLARANYTTHKKYQLRKFGKQLVNGS